MSDSCHLDLGGCQGQVAGVGGRQAGHALVCILFLPRHGTQNLGPLVSGTSEHSAPPTIITPIPPHPEPAVGRSVTEASRQPRNQKGSATRRLWQVGGPYSAFAEGLLLRPRFDCCEDVVSKVPNLAKTQKRCCAADLSTGMPLVFSKRAEGLGRSGFASLVSVFSYVKLGMIFGG